MTEIHGTCDTRFAGVRDAFYENFTARGDVGATVAVYLDDRPVVDLWGGYLDAERTRPWPKDGIVNVWSLGKAMTALCLIGLFDTGDLSPDDKVVRYWPEFGRGGKDEMTLAMALAHRGGLPGIERALPDDAFFHWDTMTQALADQTPWWEPGTAHGYHANTYGFLNGEIVRRVTGQRVGKYFREHIAGPLNADFYIGIHQRDADRVADLIFSPPPPDFKRSVPLPPGKPADDDHLGKMRWMVYNNPTLDPSVLNSFEWRAAEFPSTSPQANARAVAKIFGLMASSVGGKPHAHIPGQAALLDAITPRSDGPDLVIERPTKFGLGLQLSQPDRPLGTSPRAFGHYGNGGHLGFGDPDVPLGFAYHMNHQGFAWRDPRNIALVDAVYAAL